MRFSSLDRSEDFVGRYVSVFLCLLYFPSYDVISDVIMSDADCTPGREPRSVAASLLLLCPPPVGERGSGITNLR